MDFEAALHQTYGDAPEDWDTDIRIENATDQAIPSDEFGQCNYAVKSKCTLAAFCCILRAAEHGLYLSDNHFFNFGVKITSVATEHTVVIIDAGSRGLDPDLWTTPQINAREGGRTEYRVGEQMDTISLLAGMPKMGNNNMETQPNSHNNAYFNA